MLDRRTFLGQTAALGAGLALGPGAAAGRRAARPKIRFYGSTQQVSGSCHLLETSQGLFLIDCGLFYNDLPSPDKENREFPFDPKEVKALLLTHAHVDHTGRLPLLYEKGFRGPIYCTDCTRDLTETMLGMSQGVAEGLDEGALSARESLEGMLNLIEAVPYNTKFEKHGLTLRYTDAGHILGSAMVEVWIDGVKLLFGGDMGPDYAPLLCKPAQHFTADAVLVESTYGPTPRDVIKYEDFGARIQKVIAGGGSVLLPAFALHKTQTLVYVLNKMKRDKVLQRDVPIFVDSSTAQECTKIYHKYKEYYDPEAKAFGEPFYAARYIEEREADTLAAHGKEPAIFISTSGMLDHAAAPKHLYKMAGDPRNAVFLVGYQAPTAVGAKLLKGAKTIDLPWEEREKDQDGKAGGFKRSTKPTEIKLQVEKVSGFSSHARGQQILEWLEQFRGVGRVFVVHGDKERATGLADAAVKMQLAAVAPKRGEEFVIEPGHRVKPGKPPGLKADGPGEPAPVDK